MNYQVSDGEVAFSTAEDSPLATADDTEIAFEADHIDDAFSKGWSVLLVGTVHAVTDEEAARQLREAAYSTPWAGAEREHVMVLAPRRSPGARSSSPTRPGRGRLTARGTSASSGRRDEPVSRDLKDLETRPPGRGRAPGP